MTEDCKVLIGGVHDIKKFFDKEVLSDVINTMSEMKVNPKCVRVWGKLNMNTRIRVRCGGGYSPWMDVGDTIGQGSGGAALASQANLDKGITTMFCGSSDRLFYGTVPISPLLFQDDIFSLSGTINSARSSLYRVNIVMKQKQLQLHQDKTSYILFGSEAQKQEIRTKLIKEQNQSSKLRNKVDHGRLQGRSSGRCTVWNRALAAMCPTFPPLLLLHLV